MTGQAERSHMEFSEHSYAVPRTGLVDVQAGRCHQWTLKLRREKEHFFIN